MQPSRFLKTVSSTLSSTKASSNTNSVCKSQDFQLGLEVQRTEKVKSSSIKSISDKALLATVSSSTNQSTCKCSKTNCLKLYCECFRRGYVCNSLCKCKGCANTKDNQKEVQATKKLYLNKNLMTFSKKPKSQTSSCSCRSNRCLKRYCECFRNKALCSDKCKCVECLNIDFKTLKLRSKKK